MRLVSEGLLRDKEVLLGEGVRRDNGLNRSLVKILQDFSHGDKEHHTFLIDISPESTIISAIQKMVELTRCCGRPPVEWI